MRPTLVALLLAALLRPLPAAAQAGGRPPIVGEADRFAADRVRDLPDGTAFERLNQVLAARSLSPEALFDLAATHPGVVEQVIDPRYARVYEFVAGLAPGDLFRARQGETIVRTWGQLTDREKKVVEPVAAAFGFPKYDPEKISAVRLGPLQGQVYRFDVVYKLKKKKTEIRSINMGWPSTPERDEASRDLLARHFGARPSRVGRGRGSLLPVADASFEDPESLGGAWQLVNAVALGNLTTPVNEISLDRVSLDGSTSLRFYAEERTRMFREVAQAVPVTEGQTLRLTAQHRAESLRVEFHQRNDHVSLTLSWLDEAGNPIGGAERALGRLDSHPWELLEVVGTAPPGAGYARVALLSGVSGTSWFDALSLEVRD